MHLGIECVLLYMGLVTTTPTSKSSLETCQDFALLNMEEQKCHGVGPWRCQGRRKFPPAVTWILIKPRLSWTKFWFWYRILPESHEVHRCQILRVPRITLQLAQFCLSCYIKTREIQSCSSDCSSLPYGMGNVGNPAFGYMSPWYLGRESRREGFAMVTTHSDT